MNYCGLSRDFSNWILIVNPVCGSVNKIPSNEISKISDLGGKCRNKYFNCLKVMFSSLPFIYNINII